MKKLIFYLLILLGFSAKAQWAPANAPNSYTLKTTAFKADTLSMMDNAVPPNFYISFDGGQNWTNAGTPGFYPSSSFIHHGRLFAYEYDLGVYAWYNGSWAPTNNGLQTSQGSYMVKGADTYADQSLLVSFANNTLLRFDDNNQTWTPLSSTGLSNGLILLGAKFAGPRMYLYGQGLNDVSEFYFSDDQGQNWTLIPVSSNPAFINLSISRDGSVVLLPSENKLVLHEGNMLIPTSGLPGLGYFSSLVKSGNRVFGSTFNPSPEGFSLPYVWVSEDGGVSWAIDPQLPAYSKVLLHNDQLLAKTETALLLSTDNGQSWTELNIEGLTANFLRDAELVSSADQLLAVGFGDEGVYMSDPQFENWLPINNGLSKVPATSLTQLLVKDNNYFLTGKTGAFYSSDEGQNWIFINKQLKDFQQLGDAVLALDQFSRLLKTTNGVDWEIVSDNPPLYGGLFVWNDKLLSFDHQNNLFLSDDGGLSWNTIQTAAPYFFNMAFSPERAYAVIFGNYLYESTNEGQTWEDIHQFNKITQSILYHEGRLFVGFLEGGIEYSDNGTDWSIGQGSVSLQFSVYRSSISAIGGAIVAAGGGGLIYTSVNNGANWNAFSSGLALSYYCASVVEGGDFIYAVCGDGLWKRPLQDLTALVSTQEPVLDLFTISPNPSKGLFTIKGNFTAGHELQISVSDMAGKPVFKQTLSTGDARLDLSAYPAGFYLVKTFDGKHYSFNKIIKN